MYSINTEYQLDSETLINTLKFISNNIFTGTLPDSHLAITLIGG